METKITLSKPEADALLAVLRECNTLLMHFAMGKEVSRDRIMAAGQLSSVAIEALKAAA